MNLTVTAEKAIDAYGGEDLWQTAKYIEAEVSVTGLAFRLKCRPFFNHVKIFIEIYKPFSKITPIGKDSTITGIFDGDDVRLENQSEEILSERNNARQYFPSGRRIFYWDDLDMAYFANYAFWNYFTLPALLMRRDIIWKEIEPGLLEAVFPKEIPTHSPIQQFTFDYRTGLLIQHNYTANIISKYARAANAVLRHSEDDGLVYISARRVTPRSPNGKPFKHPILIDIEVHNFKLIN